MTPFDRRIILILAIPALLLGMWIGAQLGPGQGSTRLILIWIAVCMVLLIGLLAMKRKGWW
jgi:hypothetical protein